MHVSAFGLVACAAAGLVAFSAGTVSAADSVTWDTGLVEVSISTPSNTWTSSTFVDPGAPQYQYEYSIIEAEVQLSGVAWMSVLGQLGSGVTGSGTFGSLPAELLNDSVDEDGLTGSVLLSVDANGFGQLGLSNFSFPDGVTAARVQAEIVVTAVPEPVGLGLLAATGGLLLSRRRSTPL